MLLPLRLLPGAPAHCGRSLPAPPQRPQHSQRPQARCRHHLCEHSAIPGVHCLQHGQRGPQQGGRDCRHSLALPRLRVECRRSSCSSSARSGILMRQPSHAWACMCWLWALNTSAPTARALLLRCIDTISPAMSRAASGPVPPACSLQVSGKGFLDGNAIVLTCGSSSCTLFYNQTASIDVAHYVAIMRQSISTLNSTIQAGGSGRKLLQDTSPCTRAGYANCDHCNSAGDVVTKRALLPPGIIMAGLAGACCWACDVGWIVDGSCGCESVSCFPSGALVEASLRPPINDCFLCLNL
jgi:hypothetical protein